MVIVALVVAFLGQAVEWDGETTAIAALGVGIAAVILSLGFVTRYLEVGPSFLERRRGGRAPRPPRTTSRPAESRSSRRASRSRPR